MCVCVREGESGLTPCAFETVTWLCLCGLTDRTGRCCEQPAPAKWVVAEQYPVLAAFVQPPPPPPPPPSPLPFHLTALLPPPGPPSTLLLLHPREAIESPGNVAVVQPWKRHVWKEPPAEIMAYPPSPPFSVRLVSSPSASSPQLHNPSRPNTVFSFSVYKKKRKREKGVCRGREERQPALPSRACMCWRWQLGKKRSRKALQMVPFFLVFHESLGRQKPHRVYGGGGGGGGG